MNKMPKPRDFAEVARDVEAARASLPAPLPDEEWLKEAERLVAEHSVCAFRQGRGEDNGPAPNREMKARAALLAHLRARHGADTDRLVSDEKNLESPQ